jgi:hypothetical protein
MFRSPFPQVWDSVYKRLLDWHRAHRISKEDKPPVPLILGGRPFSSSSDKHQRWLQTVEWAQRHGCAAIVEVREEDYEVWDRDIPPWNPEVKDPE